VAEEETVSVVAGRRRQLGLQYNKNIYLFNIFDSSAHKSGTEVIY